MQAPLQAQHSPSHSDALPPSNNGVGSTNQCGNPILPSSPTPQRSAEGINVGRHPPSTVACSQPKFDNAPGALSTGQSPLDNVACTSDDDVALLPMSSGVSHVAQAWVQDLDPMLFESELHDIARTTPISTAPVDLAGQPTCSEPNNPSQDGSSPRCSTDFVNTARGSVTDHMKTGVVPTSHASFAATVARPTPPAIGGLPHRRRSTSAPPKPPRRSTRLAKKGHTRTPALLAAQNVLMRKLGITGDHPSTADHIDEYIEAFRQGLSEEQARLIAELFIEHAPSPLDAAEDEPEQQ